MTITFSITCNRFKITSSFFIFSYGSLPSPDIELAFLRLAAARSDHVFLRKVPPPPLSRFWQDDLLANRLPKPREILQFFGFFSTE